MTILNLLWLCALSIGIPYGSGLGSAREFRGFGARRNGAAPGGSNGVVLVRSALDLFSRFRVSAEFLLSRSFYSFPVRMQAETSSPDSMAATSVMVDQLAEVASDRRVSLEFLQDLPVLRPARAPCRRAAPRPSRRALTLTPTPTTTRRASNYYRASKRQIHTGSR